MLASPIETNVPAPAPDQRIRAFAMQHSEAPGSAGNDPETAATQPTSAPALPGLIEVLTALPRIDAATWQRLDPLRRWLLAIRAPVLAMTLWSVLATGLFALERDAFAWLPWLACLVGLLLAHASNNLLNDLVDHVRRVDENNYFRVDYGVHVLEQGLLRRQTLLVWALATALLAFLPGLWLLLRTGWPLLLPLLAGACFLFAYTWPLKQLGLGEPVVLLVWGPLMMGGTWVAMTGGWDPGVLLFSVIYALGPTVVIVGKHLDKRDQDAARGIGTLPVRLGEVGSRWLLRLLLLGQYAGLVGLVAVGQLAPTTLLALLALPQALTLWRRLEAPRPVAAPVDAAGAAVWPLWFAAVGFAHTRTHGGLLVLGMLLGLTV